MARQLRRVVGVGVETADMLVQEVFSREIRDRRALARYAGLTGSPDESGQRRRERGLAKAGNARVRRGMIELAWGHLVHQKGSPLSAWYRMRTADARGGTRKTMIVALARKLLIVLWRLATTGEAPEGLRLRPRRNARRSCCSSSVTATPELQTTDRGGGNPMLDYGLRAAV